MEKPKTKIKKESVVSEQPAELSKPEPPQSEPPKVKSSLKNVEYVYRPISLTPAGSLKASVPTSVMMEARRSLGWVLESVRNDPGAITDLYKRYVDYATASYADSIRPMAEFKAGLDRLVEMGLFERAAK